MTSTASWRLTYPPSLAADGQAEIRRLALAVEGRDGAEPLNEHSLLHLSAPADDVVAHIVAVDRPVAGRSETVLGYAQIAFDDGVATEAELLVGSQLDRDLRVDLGADLLAAAEGLRPELAVLVWARGSTPITDAAVSRGYTEDRILLTMRRSLAGLDGSDARVRATPPDVRIRSFQPGTDDAAWLTVNAAAFAHHPEQGGWTQTDLDERFDQPWFDPTGFLLAVGPDGELLGYHWTKVHPPARPGELPVGEVYVLGISPSAQGRGLGGVLLLAGLRHLAVGPAAEVILYVEQDNAAAVALYERDGFMTDRRDVQLRSPSH